MKTIKFAAAAIGCVLAAAGYLFFREFGQFVSDICPYDQEEGEDDNG